MGYDRDMSDIMYDEKGIDGEPYKKDDWQRIAIHDDERIHGFFGPFRFLSNFWPALVSYEGREYPSVENAYQAAKFMESEREEFQSCTPKEAKKGSIDRPMCYSTEAWYAMRSGIMQHLLKQKFDEKRNPSLFLLLKETGQKHLEETNWWDDTFWGVCEGLGENTLGNMLMQIRDEN
jgi:ribA/ribD-fused uncharacterized protein